jgi:hypothetical protein
VHRAVGHWGVDIYHHSVPGSISDCVAIWASLSTYKSSSLPTISTYIVSVMNGMQQPNDTAGEPAAEAAPANTNGSSGIAKKRKKDALKPIITTDNSPE